MAATGAAFVFQCLISPSSISYQYTNYWVDSLNFKRTFMNHAWIVYYNLCSTITWTFHCFSEINAIKARIDMKFSLIKLSYIQQLLIVFVFSLTKNARYTSNVKTRIFAHLAILPAETLFLKLITNAAYQMKGYWILFLVSWMKFLKKLCFTKKFAFKYPQFCLYKELLDFKSGRKRHKMLENGN